MTTGRMKYPILKKKKKLVKIFLNGSGELGGCRSAKGSDDFERIVSPA